MPAEAQTLKVAFLHLAPETGNPQGNLEELVRAVEEAAHGGAQLVLAPELALSGYCFRDRQEARACSEHLASASVARLAERCRHHGLTLVLGLVERDATTDLLHNTALALGPDGTRVGHPASWWPNGAGRRPAVLGAKGVLSTRRGAPWGSRCVPTPISPSPAAPRC
jgi:predicted amidohydrolase